MSTIFDSVQSIQDEFRAKLNYALDIESRIARQRAGLYKQRARRCTKQVRYWKAQRDEALHQHQFIGRNYDYLMSCAKKARLQASALKLLLEHEGLRRIIKSKSVSLEWVTQFVLDVAFADESKADEACQRFAQLDERGDNER